MSKALLVAFNPNEVAKLAGFGAALGVPFEIISVIDSAVADRAATVLADQSAGYSHIAALSTMKSKDILARLAGMLDAAMVTDVIEVVSPLIYKRPVFAGSVIATVEVLTGPVVLTVRPAGFSAETAATRDVSIAGEGIAKQLSASARSGGRPDLTQAKRIISGGRPLKDAETFERVIGGFADKIGAAVGATRAAVDSGIAANELQVGQTGKIVAPDLYIAAGISGSTQHMAGIKDSKIIVAINKDADAPIFESADFGLVADLFDALPELESLL